jgi:hypothetical protein
MRTPRPPADDGSFPASLSRRSTAQDLRVDAAAHPDWVSGADRVPQPGDDVHCASGLARVERLLGKTGDGSRLLELRLHAGPSAPFFVAASNVLVPPK